MTPPPDDADRRAVLARRAAFVSSTLAALGCSPARPEPKEPVAAGPVVSVPVAPEDAGAPTAIDAAPPPREPNSAVGEQPSMDIPAGVSATAKKRYEHLLSSMRDLYRVVAEIEDALPNCNVQDASCEASWRDIAEKLVDIRRKRMFLSFCPGTSDEAKAFAELEKEHQTYFSARFAKITEQIDAAWAANKPRWETLKQEAYQAKPFPCLSFACQDW